jgi:hypothetical protein
MTPSRTRHSRPRAVIALVALCFWGCGAGTGNGFVADGEVASDGDDARVDDHVEVKDAAVGDTASDEGTAVTEDAAPEDAAVNEDTAPADATVTADTTTADTAVTEDTAPADTAVTEDTTLIDTGTDARPPGACAEDGDCPASRLACRVARCASGQCVTEVAPDLAPCSDDNVCTTTDRCESGVCVPGPLLACDDGNPCTIEGCHKKTGCTSFPREGACDDRSACTIGDICVDGHCSAGVTLGCDDRNPCTDDACDPATGCTHTVNTAPCDDGDACTVADTCAAGRCGAGTPRICPDDDDPCTDMACDRRVGCVALFNQAPCDDHDACTRNDSCVGGTCIGGPEIVCQDAERCTTDGCNPTVGCSFEARVGPCDDGSKCSNGDQCGSGLCQPGPAIVCDDHNPCTADSCSPLAGCVAAPRDGYCDDGRACTDGLCEDGACVSTPPRLWAWAEPRDGQQWLDDVVDAGDGVVLVGTSYNYPVTEARAVKLDYYGREVWTKTYGDSWFYNGASVPQGFLFAGEGPNPDDPSGRWGGRIVRTDRAGELVDDYWVPGTSFAGIWGVAGLPDAAVAYGGYGGGFWAGAIDVDGVVLYDYRFGGARSQASDLVVLPDGEVVYLGYDSTTYQALAVRIARDGTIRWQTSYGTSGDDAWSGGALRHDGTLWVAGWTYLPSGYESVWGIMDLSDGSYRPVAASGLAGSDYALRVAPATDGGVLLAGAGQGPNGYDFLGLRVDANGAMVFSRYLGGPFSDEGYGVVATREGGMVLVGHDAYKDWRAWRLDPWGHATCEEAGACADLEADSCGDGEPCTVDRCDAAGGCVNDDRPDGSSCGLDMTCEAVECVEAP